ncbi:MAG: DUF1844 domain-containing protein [Desulfobacteraceae bacterium]|nr:DUF1844 domain-containing protein [Desulfobacteraceae bacterium]MBC2756057.1 DUF1844 domain-containing protein [Desulfobacteraceae bacterium]
MTESNNTQGDFAMPEINFSTFILSLNSSALVHLGIQTDPTSGSTSENLLLAKQTIDILAMLDEKTKGNLAEDEKRLLTHVLYELRILYVKQKEKK